MIDYEKLNEYVIYEKIRLSSHLREAEDEKTKDRIRGRILALIEIQLWMRENNND